MQSVQLVFKLVALLFFATLVSALPTPGNTLSSRQLSVGANDATALSIGVNTAPAIDAYAEEMSRIAAIGSAALEDYNSAVNGIAFAAGSAQTQLAALGIATIGTAKADIATTYVTAMTTVLVAFSQVTSLYGSTNFYVVSYAAKVDAALNLMVEQLDTACEGVLPELAASGSELLAYVKAMSTLFVHLYATFGPFYAGAGN